jgi:CxxC motif-containing protein (DUF1111 family)
MATRNRSGRRVVGRCAILGLALGIGAADSTSGADGTDTKAVARRGAGRDLFLREWTPGIPSERGGDGLGPVYNETSCVACHNQGGTGGAGGADKNIDLATAVVTPLEGARAGRMADIVAMRRKSRADLAKRTGAAPPPPPRAKGQAVDRAPLVKLHAGFAEASSVALHRFGPGLDYDIWRLTVLDPDRTSLVLMMSRSIFGRRDEARMHQMTARNRGPSLSSEFGHFSLINSERNPVALFGAGRIEAIPDAVLEAAESESSRRTFGMTGRVARLPDGRIGRFGWKAQSPTLDDFVRTACAVELGLEVPGHPQGRDPRDASAGKAARLDLLSEDCDALTEFVRALPGPGRRAGARDAERVARGESRFAAIGCTSCHTPTLGKVEGLYSDLLLHDMGDELGDSGSYGIVPPSPGDVSEPDGLPPAFPSGLDAFAGPWQRARPASRREWRTPPLWGVRDSAPYLHDGRAETLEQAIALHGGQGQRSADAYFQLPQAERAELLAFLKSLVAPGTDERPPTEVAKSDALR